MKFEKARARLCRSLSEVANQAGANGLDHFDFVQALAGTLAATVRSAGGTDQNIVLVFRMLADCFEQDDEDTKPEAVPGHGQHCPPLTESVSRL